jgi:hypothetical protein
VSVRQQFGTVQLLTRDLHLLSLVLTLDLHLLLLGQVLSDTFAYCRRYPVPLIRLRFTAR